ncbi:MAG TPA: hydroxymethylbilane synthase [Vicinamibacterales bacterium]
MNPQHTVRLGTRGSQLALYQAHTVARSLAQAGGPSCEIVIIKTSGDRLQEAPLSEVGGKRMFVKEIEDALLKGEVDLAVHSSKDMPAVLPEGLAIAGVLPREDPLDAVVLPRRAGADIDGCVDADQLVAALGQTPSIGTSSVRRIAQLIRLMPGASFMPIRGNLDTRLRKLDSGDYDALVLAAAGLRRLGFTSRISATLPVAACVPAPGQGIIAIEVRAGDSALQRALAAITDGAAAAALIAERAVVEALGGGCQTPIGALATAVDDDTLELVGAVVALDGSRAVRATERGSRSSAAELGARVAARLIEHGAGEILDETRRAQGAVEGIQP